MGDPLLPIAFNCTLPEARDSTTLIVISSISSSIVILLLLLGVYFGWRYRKFLRLNHFLQDTEVQEFLNGRVTTTSEMGSIECMNFKLSLTDLTIDFEIVLGSGNFGIVYKGLVKGVPAAIKRPSRDGSNTSFQCVLNEGKILCDIGSHINVVRLLGVYTAEIHMGVLYVATEFCSLGSLESFLKNRNTEPDASVLYLDDFNTFAMQIAQGMEYIENRRIVHRELSTRNVFLDENFVCKIGGFDLSRKLSGTETFVLASQEPIPWKWVAPESLHKMEFTSKSDVWSYGVTLWEIYSLGSVPYGGLSRSTGFVDDLVNGLRLQMPQYATKDIYNTMLSCWNVEADERRLLTKNMVEFFKQLASSQYTVLEL